MDLLEVAEEVRTAELDLVPGTTRTGGIRAYWHQSGIWLGGRDGVLASRPLNRES
jgi:hypothetical protein